MNPLTLVLWTTDIARLASFFEDVLGGVVETRHPGFASLNVGTARIEIHPDEAYDGHPWFDALQRQGAARGIGTELRFRVEDVGAAWARALRAGAVGIVAPSDLGETYECVVMGPEGFLFSLWA